MTLWSRIHDGVLARTHALGRQVALRVVGAVQRAVAHDERLRVRGTWRQVFAALGLAEPSDKAARAALTLLEQLGGVVRRVGYEARGGWLWQVCSHAADARDDEQLDLDLAADRAERKAETGPRGPAAAPGPAPAPARARAGAPARSPRAAAAQALVARVVELGAVEAGRAWAVTLTAADEGDVDAIGKAFVEGLTGEGCGALLVPEVSGRRHWHGVAIGTEAEVMAAQLWSGAGHSRVTVLRRPGRWWGYCTKDPAGDVLASGVLAEGGSDGDGEDQDQGARSGGCIPGDGGGADGAHAVAPQVEDPGEVVEAPAAADGGCRQVGVARGGLRRAIGAAWRWLKGWV